jgi:hypothetical protein
MKPISRRSMIASLAVLAVTLALLLPTAAAAQSDPLPSWNDGPAKQAILNFVKATTDQSNPDFVPPEERIATFDQDGTLWVEYPMYTQVEYCLERVPALVKAKPELAEGRFHKIAGFRIKPTLYCLALGAEGNSSPVPDNVDAINVKRLCVAEGSESRKCFRAFDKNLAAREPKHLGHQKLIINHETIVPRPQCPR